MRLWNAFRTIVKRCMVTNLCLLQVDRRRSEEQGHEADTDAGAIDALCGLGSDGNLFTVFDFPHLIILSSSGSQLNDSLERGEYKLLRTKHRGM